MEEYSVRKSIGLFTLALATMILLMQKSLLAQNTQLSSKVSSAKLSPDIFINAQSKVTLQQPNPIYQRRLLEISSSQEVYFRIEDSKIENEVNITTTSTDDDFRAYYKETTIYKPSMYVLYGAQLSPFSFAGNKNYLQKTVMLVLFIFILGFLAILLLNIGLLFRCCCECCKCLICSDPSSKNYKSNQVACTVSFYIFAAVSLIVDQIVFIGNSSVDLGVIGLQDSLFSAQDIVDGLIVDSSVLSSQGTVLANSFKAAKISCPAINTSGQSNAISSAINDFTKEADDFNTALSPIPERITYVLDLIDKYAVLYREIALYFVWGIGIFTVLFLLISRICENPTATKVGIGLVTGTYLLYLLLGVPWQIIATVGGDFCTAPTPNLLEILHEGSSRKIAGYYSTCPPQSSSVLDNYLSTALAEIQSLNTTISQLAHDTCANDENLESIQRSLLTITQYISVVTKKLDCSSIKDIWTNIFEYGLCGKLYSGFFLIWGSQLLTSFILFLLILTSTFIYHYYQSFRIVPTSTPNAIGNADIVEEEEEDDGEEFREELYDKRQRQNDIDILDINKVAF